MTSIITVYATLMVAFSANATSPANRVSCDEESIQLDLFFQDLQNVDQLHNCQLRTAVVYKEDTIHLSLSAMDLRQCGHSDQCAVFVFTAQMPAVCRTSSIVAKRKSFRLIKQFGSTVSKLLRGIRVKRNVLQQIVTLEVVNQDFKIFCSADTLQVREIL